jgi:hypothetical protein
MKTSSYLPTYEDGTECSETLEYKIQTPGNHTKESMQQVYVLHPECKTTINCNIPPFVYLHIVQLFYGRACLVLIFLLALQVVWSVGHFSGTNS